MSNSIRVNTVSLATYYCSASPDTIQTPTEVWAESLLLEEPTSPMTAEEANNFQQHRRRVSFNLRENTIMQLPSNSAINKIAHARNRRRSSLAEASTSASLQQQGRSPEELAQIAGRKAQAFLPQGASSDLVNREDDEFSLTALYVKRGHIRMFEASADENGASQSLPVKGVLKPFTPSPVDATFSMFYEEDNDDNVVVGGGGKKEKKKKKKPVISKKSDMPKPLLLPAITVGGSGGGGETPIM